jgi:hypothetical protein
VKEMHRNVCKSPLPGQPFVLNVMKNLNKKELITLNVCLSFVLIKSNKKKIKRLKKP